ncbi:hypothetical protein IWW38_003750, partial [Coemansia aciculifera]
LHIPTLLAQHAYSLAVLHLRRRQGQTARDQTNGEDQGGEEEEPVGHDEDNMSYCIDWSRSDGVVVESSAPSGISSLAATALDIADAESSPTMTALALGRHQKQLEYITNGSADRVDVVQKTMLPIEAPVKMCLGCGHVTRRELASARASEASTGHTGWIGRFSLTCVCGGSWIEI